MYDLYDYDGSYNGMQCGEAGEIAIIKIPLNQEDFVLTNEVGEKVFYNSKEMDFSGNMEIIYTQFTPGEIMIYLEPSESFTFEVESDVCEFSLLGYDVYVSVEGSDIDKVVIKADGTAELTGEDMDYSARIHVHKNDSELIKVSDTASGVVTIDGNK